MLAVFPSSRLHVSFEGAQESKLLGNEMPICLHCSERGCGSDTFVLLVF